MAPALTRGRKHPRPTQAAGPAAPQQAGAAAKIYNPSLVAQGAKLFRQECAFCHGRNADGGETGPDLGRSTLVSQDVNGDKIGPVATNGRSEAGMPPVDISEQEIAELVSSIHTLQKNANTRKGGGKDVDAIDLQTGNVGAGRQYFEGAGGCAIGHSPTGDLPGIASRLKVLDLERQMLYPKHPKSHLTVTPTSRPAVTGILAYLDEFSVALVDADGSYGSWPTKGVQFKIDAPVNARADLFSKYTDDEIHNLRAYLQTLQGSSDSSHLTFC